MNVQQAEQHCTLQDIRSMVNRFSTEGLCECLIEARQQLVDEELNRVKKLLHNKLEVRVEVAAIMVLKTSRILSLYDFVCQVIKPRLAVLSREELVTLAQQRVTLGALVQQFERSLSS